MRNDPSNVCGVTPPPTPQGKNDRAERSHDFLPTFFQPTKKEEKLQEKKRTASLFLCSARQQFDRITELCHRKFSFSGKIREKSTSVLFAKYLSFAPYIYFLAGKRGKSLCCSLSGEGDIDFFRSSSVYRVPIDHRLLLLPILLPHTTFSSSSSPKVSRVETHFFSLRPRGTHYTRKGGGAKHSTTSFYN